MRGYSRVPPSALNADLLPWDQSCEQLITRAHNLTPFPFPWRLGKYLVGLNLVQRVLRSDGRRLLR